MSKKTWNQLFGGLLLIGIGALFILNELGIQSFSLGELFSTFWPVILIYAGLQGIFSAKQDGCAVLGSFIPLIIGVYFLGHNLNLLWFSFGDLLRIAVPVILIGSGLYVIFSPKRKRDKAFKATSDDDYRKPGRENDAYDAYDAHDAPPPPAPGELESSLDEVFEQRFGSGDRDLKGPRDADRNRREGDSSYRDYSDRHEEQEYESSRRRSRRKGDSHYEYGDQDDDGAYEEYHNCGNSKRYTNKSSFIGDIHLGKDYFELKPTNISQFIGDTVIDLTRAQIPYGKTKINISAFIGDIKVFVPNDLDVGIRVSTSSFIGDMSVLGQKRSGFLSSVGLESPDYRESGKKIVIHISAFIGDVKVNKVG
ncbi:cell wall-active antibiotics response protein LiaF [Paenibacillus sp. JSM ZJ436]|uniref:cell wall-active antibiotics response protein LiaF n=1 Tax=Paenibacillus sp. JSM ZJ436 TaxID=3376190 RepID=UPI00378EC686